eukprot:1153223-Pelagomonas_calceolata.AAC.7
MASELSVTNCLPWHALVSKNSRLYQRPQIAMFPALHAGAPCPLLYVAHALISTTYLLPACKCR